MNLSIGQIIVHPQHGPATITDVFTRTMRGTPTRCLRLEVHRSDLVISMPADAAARIGLREVPDAAELEQLCDVLRAPTSHEEEGWSRRFKNNTERLRVGDLLPLAEVVRDLMRRELARGLSLGEKHLLKQAARRVAAEIALALGAGKADAATDADADALLGSLVFGTPLPSVALPTVALPSVASPTVAQASAG